MPTLSINYLKEKGAFVGPPIEKTITWQQDGETVEATVWVRPMSYQSALGNLKALRENTELAASRIAVSIVDENGKPIFSIGDITGEADPERGPLSEDITMALLTAMAEVNSVGKSLTKTS